MNNFCFDYLTNILYCVAFGVTSGAYIGMTAVILIDVIGLKKFIQGYGIQLFFMGVGLAIGPPIIGKSHCEPFYAASTPLMPYQVSFMR